MLWAARGAARRVPGRTLVATRVAAARRRGERTIVGGLQELLQQLELDPGPRTLLYDQIVALHARRRRPREAVAWLRLMQESDCAPTVHTYNACLRACASVARMDTLAEVLFGELRCCGHTPTGDSFRAMLRVYMRQRNRAEAARWLGRLMAQAPDDCTRPDVTSTLQALAQDAPLDALEALDHVAAQASSHFLARGGQPLGADARDADAVLALMQAHAAHGRLDGCRRWHATLTAPGLPPPVVQRAWHMSLQSDLETVATPADVAAVWASVVAQGSQSSLAGARVLALVRAGDGRAALVALHEMLGNQWGTPAEVSAALKALAQAAGDDADVGSQVLALALQQDDATAVAVYDALSDAVQRSLRPDQVAPLLHVYARRKTPRKAVHCLRQLMLSGQRPTLPVLNGMLVAYAAAARPEVALATFQRIQTERLRPDADSYAYLVHAYLAAGQRRVAREWAEQMQEAGHAAQADPVIQQLLAADPAALRNTPSPHAGATKCS